MNDMITILAPAKINLTLEVLGKRTDGYHEVRSVMQAISLCDRLSFELADRVEFRSDSLGWDAERSLVSRAVRLLREATGCVKGALLTMEKHIPLAGGLGGESSASAATLAGLNQLWELELSREKLTDLAQELGSDVAFFLYGGTALAEGRGEIVTPLPPISRMWVVLVVPDVPRLPEKTGQMYGRLTPDRYTDGSITRELVFQIAQGNAPDPGLLFNVFERVAFSAFPGLGDYRDRMLEAGAPHAHLAGSGPTLFSLLAEREKAEALYFRLKGEQKETHLAETIAGNL
ncbi:MAG: 4-(cytidine 5'-diphospho)-2-C-methyl-D-erythritol kinase [Chloroflexi bacterium]|nr:4-(cytidine 5'-diphospho)-2-C-methyl-D-erythritol kinase [Chloroflexota bacterium]